MPKKQPPPPPTPPECRESMGLSPAVLARREFIKTSPWCPPRVDIEYDKNCDPHHPQTIHYRHVKKADEINKDIVPITPLMKSKSCKKFGMDLYFKVETGHETGSFHERGAIYALLMLTQEQRKGGVFTASVGNWALALAHQCHLLNIPVTVVLPVSTPQTVINRCQGFDAKVVLFGKTIAQAKRQAFTLMAEVDQEYAPTYLNGYDHPHVIAAAGSIGMEILGQLPGTNAILVPIGGGGLIAGIAALVKHMNPNILIYGIEPGKSCSFFKAMDNEGTYHTEAEKGIAASLTIPKAGENSFHTARSLIDKMVLVHDDWTARAILHLAEEEKLIVEGAGAISLGALMCMPNILPELRGKKVVCIVSGGNIEMLPLVRAFARGKSVEGRLVTMTLCLGPEKISTRNKILKVIQRLGCNITQIESEREWLAENKLLDNYITLQCETRDYTHACAMKQALEKFFPNICDFGDDTFKLRRMCNCFPKRNY